MVLASFTFVFQYYAQIWLIYGLSKSALLLGMLGLVRGVAMMSFGAVGGVLADRMDRRKLLVVTELLGLILNGALSVLAITGVVNPWTAFALIFAAAAVLSVDAPIRQAFIPELVPATAVPNAVALMTGARMGAFALVPVAAGFVIDALGPGGAYAVSLAGHGVVIFALLIMRYRGTVRAAAREPFLRSLRVGLEYTVASRSILWIIVIMFLTSAFGMAIYNGPIAKWAAEVLELSPGRYGILAATFGVGTLIASYGLAFMNEIPRMGRLFAVSAVAFGGSFLLFSLTRSIPVAGFAYFVNGFSWTCTSVTGVSMVQALVRDDVRGRVMSVYSMNNSVAQLNSISLGVIADRFGMVAMMVSVTGFLTASTAVLAGLVPSLRSLDRKMAGVREEERRSEAAAAGG